MRFDDLNWFDIENYIKQDNRLMLVFGACEQHGYLSLLTDVKIPLALADTASKQTGVLVAPPANFGVSPYFLDYPGTLSLRVTTLLDLGEDLVRSAYRQGFRRFLILNGHGGNDPLRARLYEIANQLPAIELAWYSWWQAPNVESAAARHGLKSFHAAWIEAFPFTRVADLPDGEKTPINARGLLDAQAERLVAGDGVFGGPYSAGDSIMQEIFDTAVRDILEILRFDAITPPSNIKKSE